MDENTLAAIWEKLKGSAPGRMADNFLTASVPQTEYAGTLPAQNGQPARVMINTAPSFPDGAAFGTGSPAETSGQNALPKLAGDIYKYFAGYASMPPERAQAQTRAVLSGVASALLLPDSGPNQIRRAPLN